MKMKSLCLAMALVGLTSHYAAAADGTLNFLGKIVNSTCKLANGDEEGVIKVTMGAVPLSKLKNDTNGTGPEVGVNISVKDCDAGTYFIVLDGAPATDAPSTNILALDADPNAAKKVGIKLTDRNNTPVTLDKPFDPEVDPSITIDADSGYGTFNLKAYYYTWDKANVDAGAGNATARFTIIQE
ncbi:TPA: type 1 fimbrial protein [Klebsiella pneumoniae]|nr:type 1 fimbrial protein [Klebsiella pneumoniae]